ncbi:hypothetical protein QZH41_018350, partial [Actinostola sp. cb2023]
MADADAKFCTKSARTGKLCREMIRAKLVGTIQEDRYYTRRRLNCMWRLIAPASTVPIVVTVTNLNLYRNSNCSESYISFVNGRGQEIRRACGKTKTPFTVFSFGELQVTLRSHEYWWTTTFKAKYDMSGSQLHEYPIAQGWAIRADSTQHESLTVQWPEYQLTQKDRSLNFTKVVKYMTVCVDKEDDRDVLVMPAAANERAAKFTNMRLTNYIVHVLAILDELAAKPSSHWKESIRRSKSFEVRIHVE